MNLGQENTRLINFTTIFIAWLVWFDQKTKQFLYISFFLTGKKFDAL